MPSITAPNSLRSIGPPSYNVQPGAFKLWRAALANVRPGLNGATPAFAKLLAIGDSTVAGVMNGAGDAFIKSWPSVLGQLMNNYYVPTQRSMSYGSTNVADSRITTWNAAPGGGLWTLGGGGWTGSSSATTPFTFVPTIPTDTLVITYFTNNIAASFTTKCNGTTLGTTNTNVAQDTHQVTYTVTKGLNTYTIDPPTGNVYIDAIEAYDSTMSSVRMAFGGKPATVVADFNITGATREHWYTKSFLAPHLTLISLTINDARNGTGVSTYTSNMTTLVNNLRAAGSDVMFVVGPPAYDDPGNVTLTPYVNALYGLCDSLNVGMVDILARWQSQAVSYTYGYYDQSSSLHGSQAGYADMAQAVFNALKTI